MMAQVDSGRRRRPNHVVVWLAFVASIGMVFPIDAKEPASGTYKVQEKTAFYEVEYSYPRAVRALPELRLYLESRISRAKTDLISDAVAQGRRARAEGEDFQPYLLHIDWTSVADLSRWMSLSGVNMAHMGGAHPQHGRMALLWDKSANVNRQVIDLFSSPPEFSAAVRADFCRALDQRRRQNGVDLDAMDDRLFEKCPDPAGLAVVLRSADRQHFTHLGILIDPYLVGPYSEGSYDITVPVTPSILSAVKPHYQSVFVVCE